MGEYYRIAYSFDRKQYEKVADEHPKDWIDKVSDIAPGAFLLLDWKETSKEEFDKAEAKRLLRR